MVSATAKQLDSVGAWQVLGGERHDGRCERGAERDASRGAGETDHQAFDEVLRGRFPVARFHFQGGEVCVSAGLPRVGFERSIEHGARQMPLATYRGGVYTLNDALTDLQRVDMQRPSFQLLPAIEIWIEAQVMTRVAVIEARRRHLHEEPEIATSLRAQREQAILNGIYQAAVANVPAPGCPGT